LNEDSSNHSPHAPADATLRRALLRMVRIAGLLMVLILVGIAVASYLGPESTELPMQYEGFD